MNGKQTPLSLGEALREGTSNPEIKQKKHEQNRPEDVPFQGVLAPSGGRRKPLTSAGLGTILWSPEVQIDWEELLGSEQWEPVAGVSRSFCQCHRLKSEPALLSIHRAGCLHATC